MMPHHRNMVRGPCRVEASYGAGLAHALLTVRFSAQREKADALRAWLTEILAAMPARKGLVASALLHDIGAPQAAPTAEQRLRGGGDRAPDWVVLVNGYSAETVAAVAARDLNDAELSAHGALPGGAAETQPPTVGVRAVLSTESDTMSVWLSLWLEPERVRGWW